MKNIALILILLAISTPLHSKEIRYISDKLDVPLRTGQSTQHRIKRFLSSGTSLTVLETSSDGKYTRVKTRKNLEGWIQTQYLSVQPAGRDLYKAAKANLVKLEKTNKALNLQLSELKGKNQQALKNLANITTDSNKLNKELERIKSISANSMQINRDNKQLLEDNQMLKNKVDMLSTENQRLNDAQQSDNFLNGAFAVLIGVMITLMVPRLWPQKRTDWA